MSSIPLPALDVRPPQQQPSPLDEYARALQLKSQMTNAPLQTQALQNEVQSSSADVQIKQQQLKDQQAMTATMQQWGHAKPTPAPAADGSAPAPKDSSMPSYDDLVPLAIKNGASFSAVQGLQQHILAMKAQAAQIAMNDARAGSSNAEAMKSKNGMIVSAMTGVMNLPDEQLSQGIQQTAQQLAQQGLFDPQHVQQAMQLSQLAQQNPTQARQQLQVQAASLGGFSQLLDAAQKKVALGNEQGKTDPNSPLYAPTEAALAMGTAPGAQQINAGKATQAANVAGAEEQARLPGQIELARHSPMGVVMGNQLGGDQNSQALDFAADNYRKTGQMPPGLMRSPGSTVAIIQRAAQMDQQDGGGGIATNKSLLQANVKSLDNLQKNYDQVQAFEQTAEKNMDLLQQTAQKIPDLGARFANVPVRMLASQAAGTPEMAAFKAALTTAQNEAAKVLNSSNASGVLSDSSRHELQQIIDGNVPYSAMVASLNTLKQDMTNRSQSYQAQIGDIQKRIKGAGSQPAQGSDISDPFAQFGGKAHQ